MNVLYDSRWGGSQGTARFSFELRKRIVGMSDVPGSLRLFHPLEPFWLSRLIKRMRPRVYLSPGFNPPLYGSTPLLFTIHDLNYVDHADKVDMPRRAYFQYLVRPACRRAMKVLTPSEFTRRRVIDWAGVPQHSVLNVGAGVDAAFCATGERYDAGFPYLLYVGNRLPHKNVPRLLQGFAASGLAGQCKVLFSGEADDATRALAAQLGIADAVRFAGVLSEQILPSVYRGAVALVMPSLFEGFGLPVVEALACGTAVAAARATSLPEVGGEAVLWFDPLSVDEIASALTRIVHDSAVRDELRSRGLERAKLFSWGKTAGLVRDALVEAGADRDSL